MFRIITEKHKKLSQSDPVLIRQFSKKLQSDPVLIQPKLASVLIQSDPVLIHAHLCFPHCGDRRELGRSWVEFFVSVAGLKLGSVVLGRWITGVREPFNPSSLPEAGLTCSSGQEVFSVSQLFGFILGGDQDGR